MPGGNSGVDKGEEFALQKSSTADIEAVEVDGVDRSADILSSYIP